MNAIEMAFRNASKNNCEFTSIIDAAAQNIAAEKVKAKAAARAKAEREAAEAAEIARQERREALKDQIAAQNSMILFGFSYSPMDYAASYGIIWAKSLEDAKRKLSKYSDAHVWELDRGKNMIVIGAYYE